MKDYYNILGINKSASKDEIKRAYHILAHQFHPDKNNGNEKRFKEVNEAYRILSNEITKKEYDQRLREFSNPFQAGMSSDTKKTEQSNDSHKNSGTENGIKNWIIGIGFILILHTLNFFVQDFFQKPTTSSYPETEAVVQKTNEEICKDRNGIFGTYNSIDNTCGCVEGYAYGEISKKCVQLVEARDESCAASFPGTSFLKVDPLDGRHICDCVQGAYWNDKRTGCYSQADYNSQCKDEFGIGAVSMFSNNKRICGCSPGYSIDVTGNSCVTISSINEICVRDVGRNSHYGGTIENGKYNCTEPY